MIVWGKGEPAQQRRLNKQTPTRLLKLMGGRGLGIESARGPLDMFKVLSKTADFLRKKRTAKEFREGRRRKIGRLIPLPARLWSKEDFTFFRAGATRRSKREEKA